MKYGDQGAHVKKLQQKLLKLGYELPRWGADGDYGDETHRAILACVRDNQIDTFLCDCMIKAIMDLKPHKQPNHIIDVTNDHKVTHAYSRPRSIERITAIVLHQTACHLGTRVKRWHTLPAHVGVTRDGQIIWVNKFETVMWHANWFNMFSIGVEIDGNFRGVESKAWTRWKGGGRRSILGNVQLQAARQAMSWICEEVKRLGGEITHVLAHRQTSKNRRGDPGEAIWTGVGLWAQDELGLKNDPKYTKGSGLVIPKEWDPGSNGKY